MLGVGSLARTGTAHRANAVTRHERRSDLASGDCVGRRLGRRPRGLARAGPRRGAARPASAPTRLRAAGGVFAALAQVAGGPLVLSVGFLGSAPSSHGSSSTKPSPTRPSASRESWPPCWCSHSGRWRLQAIRRSPLRPGLQRPASSPAAWPFIAFSPVCPGTSYGRRCCWRL